MAVGEVIFVIALNCIIIFMLYKLQQKSLEKRIKHLKNEVQDLEDLVAAIIEEFQEIAQVADARADEVKKAVLETAPVIESDGPAAEEQPHNFYSGIHEVNTPPPIQPEMAAPPNVAPEASPDFSRKGKIADRQTLSGQNSRPVTNGRHQRILELWDQGVSIEEIARQLGTGRGEVQLILGIYRRSQ